jgi:hypothetical protein
MHDIEVGENAPNGGICLGKNTQPLRNQTKPNQPFGELGCTPIVILHALKGTSIAIGW